MARLATEVMLGKKLADLDLKDRDVPHFGVKESVFPFPMFPEVDPVLGPEMRSTGEVLGIADTFGLAFYKAQLGAKQVLPREGCVLLSVAEQDRGDLPEVARAFADLGFKIVATRGTRKFLADQGVEADWVMKMHEGRPNIADGIKNREINLVVNTPIGRRGSHDDSYIRKAAIKHQVPYITTLAAARAAARAIEALRAGDTPVRSLQEYHADIK
jgi:carbamoyl-phosphate synthase large subunit